ncbi:hypothetical protein GGR52DRAFT_563126 [Hypoxylon sp. FL1284]|nr:hypothetical protein GGR52DRAFT_563126 [Hypoxylon sp. FL1284]
MGLLRFLSRKSLAADGSDGLKAQAYNETVAANPPIRGTYPVAGNGPSILETFQKSHPHLRDVNFINNSAPTRSIPRVVERPNSAPIDQSDAEASSRPPSQPAVSARILRDPPKKRHGPYRLPSKYSNDGSDDVSTNKSLYGASSPTTWFCDRNSSVFSRESGSSRKFVDLLDAHSYIKPSNFQGRVKATGAKDYDEDVADRNMGAIGRDRSSLQIPESYSKYLAPHAHHDGDENNRPSSRNKRHSMGSSLRTRAADPDLRSAFPKTPALQASREREDAGKTQAEQRALRRSSLHSYIPSSSAARPRSAPVKAKEAGLHHFSESPLGRARAVANDGIERDLYHDIIMDVNEASANRQKPATDRPRRRTISSPLTTVMSSTSSRRGSLQSLQSIPRNDALVERKLARVEEHQARRKSRVSSKQHDELFADFDGPLDELPPLLPIGTPQLIASPTRLSSRDGPNPYDVDRTTATPKKSARLAEVEDVYPERGSIRRWSATSETAGSTLSSNPFRPQSGHTTNTSVDLTPRKPAHQRELRNGIALDDRTETDAYSSLHRDVDPELLAGSVVSPDRQQRAADVVVEEDSSSIDSFEPPQRPTREFEKDLLFQGYGLEGSQLPGLPGLFDTAVEDDEPVPSRRVRKSSSYNRAYHFDAFRPSVGNLRRPASGSQFSTRSLQYTSRPRSSWSSRHRMPPMHYSDSDDDDEDSELEYESEEELNFDIPKTRSITSRYESFGGSSRRRFEPSERRIKEDDMNLEFPSVAELARLRREAKARERAAKGKGKARDVDAAGHGLDDSSSYADVDS